MKKILLILLSIMFSLVAYPQIAKEAAKGAATKQAAQGAVDTAAPGLTKRIGELMSSPPGICVLAGIGTVNAGILRQAASDQEDEANANIVKIEAIMKTFQDSWVDHCPNGREKLEEPNCYCYLEDGKQNPNRTNSETCTKLWSSRNNKITAAPTEYTNPTGKVDPVGCVAVTGKFDETCQCRKLIDAKGNNACMKTAGSTFGDSTNSLGMGYLQNSGFNQVVSNLDSMASGTPNFLSMSRNGLANAIAKQGHLNNQLYRTVQNDPSKKGFPIYDSNSDLLKAQQAIFSPDDLAKVASATGGSALSGLGSSQPTGALAKAIDAAKKTTAYDVNGGQGLSNKKAQKSGFSLNFGDTVAPGGGAVTQNFMEKNYNFKQNDIVKKSDSSIFDIISNRYIESGLRRLFED